MEACDFITSPVHWYNVLVPSPDRNIKDLISSVPESQLKTGLLVCGITSRDTHRFALFPNVGSFVKFMISIPESRRCFFEIIRGELSQKPHFDIEIQKEKIPGIDLVSFGTSLIESFIEVLVSTFEEIYEIRLNLSKDLMIFTSHGSEKQSFHVIVDHYVHSCNDESKAFYEEVVSRLPEEYKPYIDHSVYSKKQQFRILGSQKRGSGRIKILVNEWFFGDEKIVYSISEEPYNDNHRLAIIISSSLVSYIHDCQHLKNIKVAPSPQITVQDYKTTISNDLAKRAISLLASLANITPSDPRFPYEIREISDSMIILKRLKASYCLQCKDERGNAKIHEHENPYLIIRGYESTGLYQVYFNCRRNPNNLSYFVGTLDTCPIIPTPVERVLHNKKIEKEEENLNIYNKLIEISKIPITKIKEIKKESMKI